VFHRLHPPRPHHPACDSDRPDGQLQRRIEHERHDGARGESNGDLSNRSPHDRVRSWGTPALDVLGPITYCEQNMLLDAAFPRGACNLLDIVFPRRARR
jgi:hypothetical protein